MRWTLYPIARFDSLSNAWQQLNRRGPNTPLLDADFIGSLIAEFASGRELIAFYGDEHQPAAAALLHSPRYGVWETFQPSQAPLGAWLTDRTIALEESVRSLARALPGYALVIGITQQDPELNPRPADSARLRALDYIRTARIAVAGRFEDYWSGRSKNLRHNMKRRRNRLAEQGTSTRLETVTSPAAIAQAIVDYGALESAGWKAGHGTAIAPDNPQGRFYTAMLNRFAHNGEARIYRYWFNAKPVAMELSLLRGDTLILLKSTYDESEATHAPALLMRQEIFQQVFDEGRVKKIEFYGRVLEWQTKWTDEFRILYHVNSYRWASLPPIWNLIARWKQRRAPAPQAAPADGADTPGS